MNRMTEERSATEVVTIDPFDERFGSIDELISDLLLDEV